MKGLALGSAWLLGALLFGYGYLETRKKRSAAIAGGLGLALLSALMFSDLP